ncbi:hypothetical protein A3K27_03790 [Candidatus Roizmanbacteria bacterium RIFOXYA1_FULL_37_12]|nr:MAG: hypothetical protein A3K27_03790 [Candidatus Roizmanbacteria bacterium RIFOXYA1_FULL_37_12]
MEQNPPPISTAQMEPEVVEDIVQLPHPPPPPPPSVRKPPVILVIVSLVFIFLFVAGIIIIAIGTKGKNQTASPQLPTATPTSSPPSPTMKVEPKWKTYISPNKDFSLDYPLDKTLFIDTKDPSIEFCDIGKGIVSFEIKDLSVVVASQSAEDQTPLSWVETYCPPLLEQDFEQGIIQDGPVSGLNYTSPILNVTVVQKAKKLYFIYALGQTKEIMDSTYQPMLSSFTLTP